MLPTDLIRVAFKGQSVRPGYLPVTPATLQLAQQLIDAHAAHVGKAAAELADVLRELEGATPRFRITRGLAKLLERRTDIRTDSPIDPVELRRLVFEAAAQRHPVVPEGPPECTREAVLAAVAAQLECTPDDLERGLYADLKGAQRVAAFEPIEADALLARYNVALVQGLLLRATRLEVELHLHTETAGLRYRQVFRYLRFFGLLHTIEQLPGGGYRVAIDGPMSLFQHVGRYGVQMANFLPALLLCPEWRARADILWGTSRKPYTLELSSEDGLEGHWRDRGVYLSETHRFFLERFAALGTAWHVHSNDTLVPLGGQGLWLPDFRIAHDDGRTAFLEILGYWRADYLRRRLGLLAEHGPPNLVLAVSEQMRVDKGALEQLPIEVLWFKKVLRPKQVLEAVERVARAA